ncbi:MAG: hypothetical protein EOO07_15000 [Chitinophagaceae bacterium]|nr:MAG: hypothetical protein EOO07_15000 [Chitinophagaceae bacterium]
MSNIFKRTVPDPYIRFIIGFVVLYLLLNYFNEFYIGITSKGGFYVPFLDEHLNYIRWWRTFSIESSAMVLRWLGYTVLTNDIELRVIGKGGIRLVYSCLGYGIMSVFVAFCLTFPSPFKHRYWFLVTGLILIQLLNIGRFVVLPLYWNRRKPLLGMDHHDLFNIFIYTVLIAVCYFWIRYSSRNKNAQNAA